MPICSQCAAEIRPCHCGLRTRPMRSGVVRLWTQSRAPERCPSDFISCLQRRCEAEETAGCVGPGDPYRVHREHALALRAVPQIAPLLACRQISGGLQETFMGRECNWHAGAALQPAAAGSGLELHGASARETMPRPGCFPAWLGCSAARRQGREAGRKRHGTCQSCRLFLGVVLPLPGFFRRASKAPRDAASDASTTGTLLSLPGAGAWPGVPNHVATHTFNNDAFPTGC